jgi:DNA-binding GntR family transcriptional regulator
VRRDRISDAMREHEAMVDALRRRAANELGQLMYDHMLSKCDAVCEYFREHSQEPAETTIPADADD